MLRNCALLKMPTNSMRMVESGVGVPGELGELSLWIILERAGVRFLDASMDGKKIELKMKNLCNTSIFIAGIAAWWHRASYPRSHWNKIGHVDRTGKQVRFKTSTDPLAEANILTPLHTTEQTNPFTSSPGWKIGNV